MRGYECFDGQSLGKDWPDSRRAEIQRTAFFWGRELTVGCPVVVSPLPREWSCWYRRGQGGISFLES